MKENISKHITWKEATNSFISKKKGFDNTPSESQLENMKKLALNVFEPLREYYSTPIHISSFFRCKELNRYIGGVDTSQHVANNGAAMDLDADLYNVITNKDIFDYILNNLEFDQLIAEKVEKGYISWVHVSYNEGNNRKEPFIMYKDKDNKTVYEQYSKERLEEILL